MLNFVSLVDESQGGYEKKGILQKFFAYSTIFAI